MVEVTRLNGETMIINADLIELIEAKPDTIVSLTTGRKIILRDTAEDLLVKLQEFRASISKKPAIPSYTPLMSRVV